MPDRTPDRPAQKKTVQLLKLEHVPLEPTLQMRCGINHEHIDQMVEVLLAGKTIDGPPPVCYFDGSRNWPAGEGSHRWMAIDKANKQNSSIQRKMEWEVRRGSYRDAFVAALGANATHGLKRSNEDKRKAVMTAMADKDLSKMSDGAIADLCHVSQHFVSTLRRSNKPSQIESEMNSTNVRVSRDGRSRNTTEIGKKNASEPPPEDDDIPEDILPLKRPDPKSAAKPEPPKAEKKEPEKPASPPVEKSAQEAASELTCSWANQLTHRLDEMVRECEEHKSDPMCFDFHWPSIIDSLVMIRKRIHLSRPKFKCPQCKGTGKVHRNKCQPCQEQGFMSKPKYKLACNSLGIKPEQDG